jgi:hypothetical protein
MTTDALEHDGPARRTHAGRLGALAGVTPVVMFVAWNAIFGWGGTNSGFVQAVAQISFGAVVAGWIVGGRVGRSLRGRLLGLVTYGVVAWLVVLPLNVAGSTWEGLRTGQVSGLPGILVAAGGYLLYGLVSSLYAFVYLMPFGTGWILTFLLLRRALER